MEGEDLFEYMKRREGFLSESQAKSIFAQALLGVKYLHSIGVVHRDLKPENIMMSSMRGDAIPKIVDFGLATYIAKGQFAKDRVGSPEYCAPEIVNKIPYDHKVDTWSMGATLYKMICGKVPFRG